MNHSISTILAGLEGAPVLLLDASGATCHAALWTGGRLFRESEQGEAGIALFHAAARALAAARIPAGDVAAFLHCEGPGSQLGARISAMAVRTWNALRRTPAPVYAYRSLELAAAALAAEGAPCHVISDARRAHWFAASVPAPGSLPTLSRLTAGEAAALSGHVWTCPEFRAWAQPPAAARATPYSPVRWLEQVSTVPLFTETGDPDALQLTPAQYVRWTPDRHR